MVDLGEYSHIFVGIGAAVVVFALAVVVVGGTAGFIVGAIGTIVVLLLLGVRNMMGVAN